MFKHIDNWSLVMILVLIFAGFIAFDRSTRHFIKILVGIIIGGRIGRVQ